MLRFTRAFLAASGTAMTPRTALKILALSPSADLSHSAIKKAYLKQTLLCHPDLHPNDPSATDKFRSLSDALRVALKALEVWQGLAKKAGNSGGGGSASEAEDEMYDSQEVLEALRRAIIAYRVHRRSSVVVVREETTANAGREECAEPGTREPPSSADSAGGRRRGGEAGEEASEQKSVHENANGGEDEEEEDAIFFSPSLEYVSAVCRKEALAMRRVQAFCEELPVVLCGSRSTAMFESVAFFRARYVQATSACVMRFSKNLPIIVRRVVRNRRAYVKNTRSKAATGFGTGDRPRNERIEDVAMKPLVLVGALIFDVPSSETPPGDKSGEEDKRKADGAEDVDGGSVASTCGVTKPSEITVSDELKCVIYPADSIATITHKLGKWEAASYERLKLELAIVDACAFISSMLSLPDNGSHGGDVQSRKSRNGGVEQTEDNALTIVPNFSLGWKVTERVLLTLQKLSAALCNEYDEDLDHTQQPQHHGCSAHGGTSGVSSSVDEKIDTIVAFLEVPEAVATAAQRQRTFAAMEAESRADDQHAAASLSTPVLIAECRRLAALAAPGLKGSIHVSWTETSDLVLSPDELAAVDEEGGRVGGKKAASASPCAGSSSADEQGKPGFVVGRHGDCCTAEMIEFAVSVDLCKDLRAFLLRLRCALKTVTLEYAKGHRLLEDVVRIRDATVNEEFIPENAQAGTAAAGEGAWKDGTMETSNVVDADQCEDERRYRYRGPIFNFARLFNLATSRELVFWQLVHKHREYIAQHAAAMSLMNVYFDCLPTGGPITGGSNASTTTNRSSRGGDGTGEGADGQSVISGWIGESAEEDGAWDSVVLTAAQLEDPADFVDHVSSDSTHTAPGAFRQWLEEVVEQSSLNKECRTILDEAGIGYVRRDPTLPLPNYLSFIKVFVQAAAVRSVLEHRPVRAPNGSHGATAQRRGGGAAGEDSPRTLTADDVGLAIVVGYKCDVRDGGRMLVPWSMDPNTLIALLTSDAAAVTPKLT